LVTARTGTICVVRRYILFWGCIMFLTVAVVVIDLGVRGLWNFGDGSIFPGVIAVAVVLGPYLIWRRRLRRSSLGPDEAEPWEETRPLAAGAIFGLILFVALIPVQAAAGTLSGAGLEFALAAAVFASLVVIFTELVSRAFGRRKRGD
jgi:hypothetical protein